MEGGEGVQPECYSNLVDVKVSKIINLSILKKIRSKVYILNLHF